VSLARACWGLAVKNALKLKMASCQSTFEIARQLQFETRAFDFKNEGELAQHT